MKESKASSIYQSCADGNIEQINEYIKICHDINSRNEEGGTLLHYASANGRFNIAKILVNKGADINFSEINFPFYTPYAIAIINEAYDICEFFEDNGGDFVLCLKSFINGGDLKQIKQLIENEIIDLNFRPNDNDTILALSILPSFWGSDEVTKYLILRGSDVNSRSKNDLTPLDYALRLTEIASDGNTCIKPNRNLLDFLCKHGGKTREELKAEGK